MTHIHLIRHGQASAGTDNYDRLSKTGQRQAALLGQFWTKSKFNGDVAFAGTLERQQHTASIALDNASSTIPVHTLAELNEYNHRTIDQLFGHGITSDGPESITNEQYHVIMQRWRNASVEQTSEKDSWASFSQRGWNSVKAAYEQHSDASSLLFFTSGGVISCILHQALGLSFEHTVDLIWHTKNASITSIAYDGNKSILLGYNNVAHLDAEFDRSLITMI